MHARLRYQGLKIAKYSLETPRRSTISMSIEGNLMATTEAKRLELIHRLIEIDNTQSFVISTTVHMHDDSDIEKMLEYVDSDGWDNTGDILVQSLLIQQGKA